jgi:alkylation response protein AidB-like acyl-CoA dehydrogenase
MISPIKKSPVVKEEMMSLFEMSPEQKHLIDMIKEFAKREIAPYASELEHKDEYPFEIVEKMKEIGLFGLLIPEEYGGAGINMLTYALVIEELTRVWMSIAGIINSHLIMSYIVAHNGTDEQKARFLPFFATGEKRGGVALTEPNAGSDLASIETTAVRDGDHYVVNGTKMFITNSRHGNTLALLVKTDRNAKPPYRGISLFIAEKGPGFNVVRDIHKIGYRGLDTCELYFDNYRVPAANLVGGVEGKGFYQLMSAMEVGRINVAARGLGLARAAFEDAIAYSQQRVQFGKPICEHQAIQIKLADMATNIEAARLLILNAASKKDKGERADMEAGMAKLFASEVGLQATLESMRIHGGYGYTQDFNVERYYRDVPLMAIGEGTNEIQRTIIARNLINRYQI